MIKNNWLSFSKWENLLLEWYVSMSLDLSRDPIKLNRDEPKIKIV